ncbi:MAG TPA: hypothetical protein VE974_03105 [Thermoanaerobaculia bacterium]|nr:hypothetical protein [Thermoanaerobaculia bacterium]
MSDTASNDPTASQTALRVVPRVVSSAAAFSELASTLIAAISRVSAAVPAFDDARVTKDFIARKLRVPAPFVTEAVSALVVAAELRDMHPGHWDRTLIRRQYIDAFIPLLKHMEVATKKLRFDIDAQQALLAADAQQIYAVTKALARDREATALGVHVGNMRRALRAARRRRRAGR